MTELPRTEDPPRSEEGIDPARVEEAFGAFADRVRELESVAGELRSELRALRRERAARTPSAAPAPHVLDDEAWPVEPGTLAAPDWIAAVPPPALRPVTIPRLVLEGVFLLLVALFAGLAGLSAGWIVLLMAIAWALVALSEWAAAAKRARWRLDEIPEPVAEAGDAGESTGPWSMPVVHATVVAPPEGSEDHTVVAKLPEAPDEADAEPETSPPEEPATLPEEPTTPPGDVTDERPPRRGLFRRRRAADPVPADPWEGGS